MIYDLFYVVIIINTNANANMNTNVSYIHTLYLVIISLANCKSVYDICESMSAIVILICKQKKKYF